MPELFCNPITGNLFRRACTLSKGGLIKEIFAANLGEIDTITVVDGIVTAITMKINPITSDPYYWYRIVAKKQSAGIDNLVVIGTNTRFIEQGINFEVEGFDTENKLAFQSLINGQAVFIGQDAKQVFHMLGHVSGAEMSEGNIGTGIALDDFVGAKGKFIAQELFVTPTVEAGLTISVLASDGVTVETVTF